MLRQGVTSGYRRISSSSSVLAVVSKPESKSNKILSSSSQSIRCFSSDVHVKSHPPAPSLSLYTWGTNTKGSLLQEKTATISWEPKLVETSTLPDGPIHKIVCGPTDTAVILENGDVYVAGPNTQGQLGLGHMNPVETLTQIPNLPPIATMALGPSNACAITKEGDLYTFGFGGSLVSGMGCLGHGDGESQLTPKLVDSIVQDGVYVQDAVLGESHMTVLTTQGEVLTTGASSYGRLGNGETSVDSLYLEPVEILGQAQQIAGGKSFSLALQDGVIYGWGRSDKGQLGTGFGMAVDMYAMEQVPSPIDSDELINRTVTKIAAGHSHAACITQGGELFLWGMALHLEPVRVAEVLHTKIVDVACGHDYTMALSEDNHLYLLGKGKTGVLGMGLSVKKLNQAQMLNSLADEKVVYMTAGWTHAACLVDPKGEGNSMTK
jgi:alpha-tubulin suppressor-like RCC1 family protein